MLSTALPIRSSREQEERRQLAVCCRYVILPSIAVAGWKYIQCKYRKEINNAKSTVNLCCRTKVCCRWIKYSIFPQGIQTEIKLIPHSSSFWPYQWVPPILRRKIAYRGYSFTFNFFLRSSYLYERRQTRYASRIYLISSWTFSSISRAEIL